jgi:hypothetical protein
VSARSRTFSFANVDEGTATSSPGFISNRGIRRSCHHGMRHQTDQSSSHGVSVRTSLDEPVQLDRGLADDGTCPPSRLLADPTQSATRPVSPVLVVGTPAQRFAGGLASGDGTSRPLWVNFLHARRSAYLVYRPQHRLGGRRSTPG